MTWKRKPAPTITPSENKPNTEETEKPITSEREGPKTSDTASSKAEKTTIPQTGDTSNVPLWFAMLIASAGVAISTAIVSKKKRYITELLLSLETQEKTHQIQGSYTYFV